MKGKTAHCDWKSAPQKEPCPCDRYKHACVICRGFVYLHGGWNTTSLRDFWCYNIVKDEWEMLDYSRDGQEELEEHSVVAYKGNLYIFRGMMGSAFTQAKTALWRYDTDSTRWTECRNVPAETESLAPGNRKGHSAVVYCSSMYIYGGYFGIKGISQEFWTFHFGNWLCVSSPSHDTSPGPLHGHSAVVYRTGMYLFRGPMGLSEQKDLWKWDFVSSSWSNIRTSQGPPPVVGHASIVCKDSMLIFGGGISNSSPNDDLWKYHFHIQTWKKLSSTAKTNFPPKKYHCFLGIGVDFQTTSDFTDTFLSHWKNGQKDHCQLVPTPRHTCFRNYFQQQPVDCALGSRESNAIEMKTFSLPMHFRPPQEAELGPNRDTSLLSEDQPLPLFATFAAAQTVGEEEGGECGCTPAGDELGSSTSTLLLVRGKPLSGFAEISFRQMQFDSL